MYSVVDDHDRRPDCFNIVPPPAYNYFSIETPRSSPTFQPEIISTDPALPLLLACTPPSFDHMSSRVSHRQSNSMSSSRRSRPHPVQNVLDVSSDSSGSDSSGKSSLDYARSTPEFARCSRCQRTASFDFKTGKNNMIEYGLNLWYCNRCATMVGLVNR